MKTYLQNIEDFLILCLLLIFKVAITVTGFAVVAAVIILALPIVIICNLLGLIAYLLK